MTATFDVSFEMVFNFLNRPGVIWYTSGNPVAFHGSPFMSFTRPGAAVKILAMPLFSR
jgi:hypothetical protein